MSYGLTNEERIVLFNTINCTLSFKNNSMDEDNCLEMLVQIGKTRREAIMIITIVKLLRGS